MNRGGVAQRAGQAAAGERLFPTRDVAVFALVVALFFLWGMSNNLTDILVQQFRKSFELTPAEAQLVQTAVFLGYFLMALPTAMLTRAKGYKAGILLGLGLFGVGLLLFWPAAVVGRYSFMLGALLLVGSGSAVLEASANPYVAGAGPAGSSERRLNFAQSFNPPGTITGVLVGTYFIFSGVELSPARVMAMKVEGSYAGYLHGELMRVVPTYVTLGCVVLGLAVVLSRMRFAAMVVEAPAERTPMGREIGRLLRMPGVVAAIGALFCYCAAQVSTWSAFIPYLRQYTPVAERTAGLLLTGNLLAFALGRLLSTWAMRWFRPVRMMVLYAVVNVGLLLVGMLRPGATGAGAILLSSFFMSLMYPTIFALGIKGLGAETYVASSLLVMAVIGAGVGPPLLGWIARRTDSYALGYGVAAAGYLVVAAYGVWEGRREPVQKPEPGGG